MRIYWGGVGFIVNSHICMHPQVSHFASHSTFQSDIYNNITTANVCTSPLHGHHLALRSSIEHHHCNIFITQQRGEYLYIINHHLQGLRKSGFTPKHRVESYDNWIIPPLYWNTSYSHHWHGSISSWGPPYQLTIHVNTLPSYQDKWTDVVRERGVLWWSSKSTVALDQLRYTGWDMQDSNNQKHQHSWDI